MNKQQVLLTIFYRLLALVHKMLGNVQGTKSVRHVKLGPRETVPIDTREILSVVNIIIDLPVGVDVLPRQVL